MTNEITLAKIEEIRKLAESAILSPTWSRSIDFERACTPAVALALLDLLQAKAKCIAELENDNRSLAQSVELLKQSIR